jgi:hypothetical protein
MTWAPGEEMLIRDRPIAEGSQLSDGAGSELMHWRNSANAHRPRSSCANANGPDGAVSCRQPGDRTAGPALRGVRIDAEPETDLPPGQLLDQRHFQKTEKTAGNPGNARLPTGRVTAGPWLYGHSLRDGRCGGR